MVGLLGCGGFAAGWCEGMRASLTKGELEGVGYVVEHEVGQHARAVGFGDFGMFLGDVVVVFGETLEVADEAVERLFVHGSLSCSFVFVGLLEG